LPIGTPDGVEIVSLAASVLLAMACIPYGFQMIRAALRAGVANEARG